MVISRLISAHPNYQRQEGFTNLLQEVAQGMTATDAPTTQELLLVSANAVELHFVSSAPSNDLSLVGNRVQGVA